MIVLPLLDKYTTANYCLSENNIVVEFGVVNDKEDAIENTVELHLCCPMSTQEVYNYCNSRIPSEFRKKILLGVREYNENKDRILPKVSIWKLDWFCKNIKGNKIANITIHREDNSDITYKFNADDEECVNKLIKIIKNNAY